MEPDWQKQQQNQIVNTLPGVRGCRPGDKLLSPSTLYIFGLFTRLFPSSGNFCETSKLFYYFDIVKKIQGIIILVIFSCFLNTTDTIVSNTKHIDMTVNIYNIILFEELSFQNTFIQKLLLVIIVYLSQDTLAIS